MSDMIKPMAEWAAAIVEAIGIAVIVTMAIYAMVFAGVKLLRGSERRQLFNEVRQRLGSGILLGLEFLVAADIVHTVAVELTFTTVGVLAIIVAIRTFLSFTLEVELTGNWPWQNKPSER